MTKKAIYSTGKFADKDAVYHLQTLIRNPEDRIEIQFMGSPLIDIGGLAILGLAKQTSGLGDRLIINCDELNPDSYQFLKRVHLLEPDGNPGLIFPLRLFSSEYSDGMLLTEVPVWLQKVAREGFSAPDASISEAEKAIMELVANVVDHSASKGGGILVGEYFPIKKHIQIVVVDFGNSIPATLSDLFPTFSDEEIINEALKPGVSRRLHQGHNYGMGLDLVKAYALFDENCALKMISRNGFLSYTLKEYHCRPSKFTFPGTYIRLQLSSKFINQGIEILNDVRSFEV
ncbi:MAG: sensor histidine kinase [Holophagaceae bacterium]|nr:sensor histidine kinase [Holophagaceae bacterium]